MRVFDFSFESPAENLALDEVLLERADAGTSGECLRFWESPSPFVVLGLTQSVEAHVDVAACERDGVPIQRRCSAGGCVIQAPGCLNFAFVLSMDRPGCDTIHGSYKFILGTITGGLNGMGIQAHRAGTSDLAIGDLKVSGNSQKRKRLHFLHHGTLLYGFDITLCAAYLREPFDRPDYRGVRPHKDFLTNIDSSRDVLIKAVSPLFPQANAAAPSAEELAEAKAVAKTKYARGDWVYRR